MSSGFCKEYSVTTRCRVHIRGKEYIIDRFVAIVDRPRFSIPSIDYSVYIKAFGSPLFFILFFFKLFRRKVIQPRPITSLSCGD